MYVHTVNILKIREIFVHFKSYLLKFRRQYELLCCLLAKIRAFLQNWSIACPHFYKVSV